MYSSQAVSATNVVGAEWLKILEVFTGKECRRRVNKKLSKHSPCAVDIGTGAVPLYCNFTASSKQKRRGKDRIGLCKMKIGSKLFAH